MLLLRIVQKNLLRFHKDKEIVFQMLNCRFEKQSNICLIILCVFFFREADCYPIPLTEKLHITPVKCSTSKQHKTKQQEKKMSQNNKVFVVKSTEDTRQ